MNYYTIISNQIGSGSIGKVYQIMETNPPNNILIAKIFEDKGNEQYNNERDILTTLTNLPNNNYIIKIKNLQINIDFSDLFPYNSNYILFDYLKNGNLSDYLYRMDIFTGISENIIKLISYKLLNGLKIIHENQICHNKIDINNIMFDNDYNPIIIHFSEAFRITNNNFKKDYLGLAKTIGKLMTSGQLKDIRYYSEKKCFLFEDNFKRISSGKKFWIPFEGKISEEFLDFLNILIKSKRTLNIDDLLNNPWLQIINDKDKRTEIENNCKKYFQKIYNNMLDIQRNEFTEFNISSIINIPKGNNSLDNQLINAHRSIDISENYNYKLEIKKINNEPKGVLFDFIQIIVNSNNDCEKPYFIYNFLFDLEENIKKIENTNISIDYPEQYLSISVTFKENINNEINICEECCDEDMIIFDEEEENDINNEKDDLEIKIDLLKYNQNNEVDLYQDKYYLMFNYIQGDICDYYYYLNIIKKKAKLLLNNIINK